MTKLVENNYFLKTIKELNLSQEIQLTEQDLKVCEQHLPEYLFSKLLSQAILPDSEHLKYCECSKPYIEEFTKKAINYNLSLYEQRGLAESDDDEKIKNNYLNNAKEVLRWDLLSKFFRDKNLSCVVERREIFKLLVLFAKKYDFNDPRVFVIVDSLVHQMLSAYRMQIFSNAKGILSSVVDREGNERFVLNPVEDLKLKYDSAKIKAIEVLDKIIEGSKVSINGIVGVQPVSITEVLKSDEVIDGFVEVDEVK